LIVCTTPEVPWADWPPLTGNVCDASYGHAAPALALTHSVKFCVVPESSERCTGVIAVLGSLTPSFSFAMAGSFHLVILPSKILATVAPSRFSESTPLRLKAIAIGLM
jgi:anti-sigma factor RsiW